MQIHQNLLLQCRTTITHRSRVIRIMQDGTHYSNEKLSSRILLSPIMLLCKSQPFYLLNIQEIWHDLGQSLENVY